MNVAAIVADEALEDRAVLGVYGQQRHAPGARSGGHEAPGHHQRFLVGQGHRAPGLDGRHRRQQADAAHERREHDVGVDVTREGHEPVDPRQQLGPRRRQQPRQRVHGRRLQQRHRRRRVLPAQVGDQLGVGAARGHAGHRELLGEAGDELERAQADRAGGAEQRDALHAHPASREK